MHSLGLKRLCVNSKRDTFKFILIAAWLLFTVTFALWWFKFSTENISLLAQLEPERMEHWARQRRMVLWEGASWVVLLVLGGLALIALVERERLRGKRIKEFFASFSHEVKTSLASLRIQAEALKESGEQSGPILERLIGDTVRLQVQLENSLFLASQDNLQIYIQSLSLNELMERMHEQWPELRIHLRQNCKVSGDERALRTIFSNLLQNAIVHGRATEVSMEAQIVGGRLQIDVRDNGSGFEGNATSLGKLFFRPKATSGSGLGLYICRLLLRKMNGDLTIEPRAEGFHARLLLQGQLL